MPGSHKKVEEGNVIRRDEVSGVGVLLRGNRSDS
jgi:hypothetical protein